MARFFFHIWQFLRTKIFEMFLVVAPSTSVTCLVYFLDIPIFIKAIIIFIILFLATYIFYYIGIVESKDEFIKEQGKLIEKQNEFIKELTDRNHRLLKQGRDLLKQGGRERSKMEQRLKNLHKHAIEYTKIGLHIIKDIKHYIQKNRFYVASKSTEGSRWILIDDISLFVAEYQGVKAFKSTISTETGTSIELEYNDVGASLDQLERKIEKSGWKEGMFLRVSSDILIKLSAIEKWDQEDKDRMILYLQGGDECETVIFKKNKRTMRKKNQKSVKIRDGLILPQSRNNKYKENQAKVKNLVSKCS